MSCVVRPFNTIVGSAAINESILSMKSMPADGKSNSVTTESPQQLQRGEVCHQRKWWSLGS